MKRIILTAAILIIASLLFSHPASDLKAEFNLETATLRLEFTHNVGNPQSHYIAEIVVYLNDKEIIKQTLSLQQTEKGGSLSYIIPDAKENDTIEIKATCNKFGSKNTKLTVISL